MKEYFVTNKIVLLNHAARVVRKLMKAHNNNIAMYAVAKIKQKREKLRLLIEIIGEDDSG